MNIENVKIVHFTPGRVRLKVKELKGAPEVAHTVQRAFEAVPGIKHVEVSTVTGSVIIEYDIRAINSPEAAHVLSETLESLFPTLDVPKLLAWLAAVGR